MKKLVILFLLIFIFACSAQAVDLRAIKLKKFLSRYTGTPLINHVQEILYCSDKFGLDYRLYVAITCAESGYGRRFPKSTKNLTGYNSCKTTFNSIWHNIYRTHELIATHKWYAKYRKTNDILDFVYTWKGVPPYEHYIKNIRYALDGISKVSVEKEREMVIRRKNESSVNAFYAWGARRYDKF
ncbi:MAG: hypothetical protein HQ564_02400 [Candidatus Saganbacteria bacterium]|nr:hypothetical protein [Candidatus Saganbacteria bacterium]